MLQYITGFAKSGKSDYSEQLVARLTGSTVYIGTLPKDPYYETTIQLHKKRRPDTWKLIELIGDPESDFKMLQDKLSHFQNILFDGLSFYLFRLLTIFDEDLSATCELAESLIDWAVQSTSNIIIVDSPVPSSLPKPIRKVLFSAHLLILQRAAPITFINKGIASSITKDEAIQLDCLGADTVSDHRIVHMIENSEF